MLKNSRFAGQKPATFQQKPGRLPFKNMPLFIFCKYCLSSQGILL